jgi:hypothetical protein
MIRIGTIAWFVVLALLGVGLFQVKYAVQSKERDLRNINKQITADRQILRVLEAEWSYLNDPVRLADLTRRHTDLAPAMANQIAGFGDLRARPAADTAPNAPLIAEGQPPLAPLPASATQSAAIPAATVPAATPSAPASTESDAIFQTSSGSHTPEPAVPVDEDATIRAILADMEAQQESPAATTPDLGGDGVE